MAGRSLRASAEGIERARTAYKRDGWTQEELKSELGLKTRQPITRFFAAEPIERHTFIDLCRLLGLEVEEIAEPESVEKKQGSEVDIDALVQEIRENVKPNIRERCGTMRVLDMTQPIELTGERGIYTNVNILEKITGRKRLDIAELMQNCDPEDFDRFGLNRVSEEQVPGLEAVQRHSKLMMLGKPGAGKTTFLKYLAMQCIEGQFQADRVPLFITLKDFAEAPKQPDVLEYIAQQLSVCGVADASVKAEQLLKQGRALMLLDGLDEVRDEDTKRILTQIRDVSDQFHSNQFVITCRIAAKDYTFERFTEVEVADFNQEQIAIFAQNWFRLSDPIKANHFIQKLKENKPIQELITNPLLLTLLCLVFGETADFPANRSELYKEGLDVLLKKWDAKRNIERHQVYKNLSLQRKEDLLSQVALTTFEQKDYFFKQKTVEAYIADFIRNLPNADTDPEVLRLDSEAVLKSIEAQHGLLVERAKGIYSFSHLTFQEYLAAREIIANSALKSLVEHITEKRWREVFLLTAGMMRKADDLVGLMKQRIDGLVVSDEQLQSFLKWVSQKSSSVQASYQLKAINAFYFGHELALASDCDLNPDRDLALARRLDSKLVRDFRNLDLDISYTLTSDLAIDRKLYIALDVALAFPPDNHLDDALRSALDFTPELGFSLQQLREGLPEGGSYGRMERWQAIGSSWVKAYRDLMAKHRNIGHDWSFSMEQKNLLWQYYDANTLLVDCLNSDCYVSREVRQEIEDTLLLPMAEIEKRQQGKVGSTPLSDRSRTAWYQLRRWRSHKANKGKANR